MKGLMCREMHNSIFFYEGHSQVTAAPTTTPLPSLKILHSLLIKHSNAMNYWSEADVVNWILLLFLLVRENLLFFLSVYSPAPILFPVCVHSMKGDSSRTQISPWGMKRWQRCMPRPLLLSGQWKEKHWHSWQGKCDIFCIVISHIFKLMPCLK